MAGSGAEYSNVYEHGDRQLDVEQGVRVVRAAPSCCVLPDSPVTARLA